jgi:predicted RNA-binding protein with RPS1 domain
LVHISKIPLDLIEALKKRAPIPSGSTVSEIESLFSAGDIVKVRVLGANKEGKLDMAMVPPLTAVQEESFNFVEGRDSEEAPEVSEDDEADSDDAVAKFDAEDTLVWWRGAPYVKSSAKTDEEDEDLAEATEENVAFELDAMIEGTWRRMFELDMQEDAADFESKASDKDIKELEEEIGDLMGMDEELIQDGFGIEFNYEINSLGNSIPIDMIPEQWRSEMSYYNDFETEDKKRMEILRGGKKRDDQDLQGVIVLTEKEMAEANKGKRVSDFTPSDKIVSSEVGTEAEAPAPVE